MSGSFDPAAAIGDAGRYETALRVLHANLRGVGLDALKDISARNASIMADYIEMILSGMTPEDAARGLQ